MKTIPQNNTPLEIQTRKFEFEYATLNVKQGFFGKRCEIKRYRGETEGFTEDLGNGVTLEMIKIPGGSFIMGTPEEEEEEEEKR
jgi:formylglycine-generating enzyme required for sulfatase activity